MPIDELEIANPEAAARIVEPGSGLHAFLLRVAHPMLPDIGRIDLPKPFLLWGELIPKTEALGQFQCDCRWVLKADPESWEAWRQFSGEVNPGWHACSCMGDLLE